MKRDTFETAALMNSLSHAIEKFKQPCIAAGLLIAFALLMLGWHKTLQDEATFSKVKTLSEKVGMKPFTQDDNGGKPVYTHYRKIDNEHLLSWDAVHYDEIRRTLYKGIWEGFFAFYPLFPLMWRASGLSPIGISIVNYLMFCIGVALVALLFGRRLQPWMLCLPLLLPCLTPYMIPYSESLFFLAAAAGMVGFAGNRYWLYFIGMLLASATRAAGNIMMVAWVIVDVIAWLYRKDTFRDLLANLARHLLPIAVGIALVLLLQHWRGAEHWFQYAIAQKEWGKSLSWPTLHWTDWSIEGKSVSWPLIYAYGIPLLAYLTATAVRGLRSKQPLRFDSQEATTLFCVLFLTGNILLALLTQHGCMYSQARLLTCTPFFLFLVFRLSTADMGMAARCGLSLMVAATLCCFSYMLLRPHMAGIWMFAFLSALTLWGRQMHQPLRIALLAMAIVVNLMWQALLLNTFMEQTWLFI